MSKDSNSRTATGMGFAGWLGLLFVGLKLTGHIDWAWVWVLAPIWIPPIILLALATAMGLLYIIIKLLEKYNA